MYNYWAILVAAVASIILGMIWYGPLFGKVWKKLSKIKPAKGGMFWSYLGMIMNSLIIAFVLAWMMTTFWMNNLKQGVILAVIIWIGFIVTVESGSVLWEKKPIKLFLINSIFRLISLVGMALIVVAWP